MVATRAQIVALGGTSYAATQITGKDVKNGSLSGKDESLSGSDLKKQSVPSSAAGGRRRRAVRPTSCFDPALPTTIAGKPMRLRAVTACWDDTTANMVITDVIISTFREDASAVTDVVEIDDPNDQNVKTCKRYDFTTPVVLAGNSRVNLKVSVGWGALNATLHLGGVTFELDRA